MSAAFVHGEVETPGPLRAPGGEIDITGWCFAEGSVSAPEVRMVIGRLIVNASERRERLDVAARFPDLEVPISCGFRIQARDLSYGAAVARFEARVDADTWIPFRVFTVVAGHSPARFVLESPREDRPLRKRMPVEGWFCCARAPTESLSVRYGHQETQCEVALPTPNVATLFPAAPHAGRSGFRTRFELGAAHGVLRFKARLADGTTVARETSMKIEIPVDENIGPEINLAAPLVPLPIARHRPQAGGNETDSRSLNILFVLPGDFSSNSALHVIALANHLASSGHRCRAAVPGSLETLEPHASPALDACLHSEATAGPVRFTDGRGPDVIHAWTTRENVRQTVRKVRERDGGRLVIHLEDNELHLLARILERGSEELAALSEEEIDGILPGDLSHPRRAGEFLKSADGVTVVVDRLREIVPPGLPCLRFWPAADERYFFQRPRPDAFRKILNLHPDETVLFYHGNVHPSNAADVRALYEAVAVLNESGSPVTLVRTGLDRCEFLGDLEARISGYVLSLGQILHHRHLPDLMAIADIFVQPGEPDAFNDYRFPSKLPEFFAIGRPVILPKTNLGTFVEHGREAYVLARADATGIAEAVRAIHADPALAKRLSSGATRFAASHFSWEQNAAQVAEFYTSLLPSDP